MTFGAPLFLAFLILQRLSELVIAKRNTRRLKDRGAYEIAPEHYGLIVATHVAWITALVVFGHNQPISLFWLAIFSMLQVFRIWILGSLGERWTTRIIILEEPLVARGPYKFMKHPNYALVVAEIAVAPLVLGLTWVAVLFTLINAVVLAIRIRAEEGALSSLRMS